jgi:hypothetical protein
VDKENVAAIIDDRDQCQKRLSGFADSTLLESNHLSVFTSVAIQNSQFSNGGLINSLLSRGSSVIPNGSTS